MDPSSAQEPAPATEPTYPGYVQFALLFAAFAGLSGVAAGALGAHALEGVLSADGLKSFETGVRYQVLHALFLLFLGLWERQQPSRLGRWLVGLTVVGIVLFSGSIYLLQATGYRGLPLVLSTPLGGGCLLVAWGLLFLRFFQRFSSGKSVR